MRLIKIYLTKEIPAEDLEICCLTAQSLKEAIKRRDDLIVTTQTHALTSSLYKTEQDKDRDDLYDDIILINDKEQLSMRDVLSGKYSDYIREIRIAHNWEKMLYSGVFEIPKVWTYEPY